MIIKIVEPKNVHLLPQLTSREGNAMIFVDGANDRDQSNEVGTMKTLKETGKATTKDFSLQADGKTRNDGSKEVEVAYSYEYSELETAEELNTKFSIADLMKLANRSLKATANSGARQKALAPYAPDPNSPDVIKARMLNDLIKLGVPEEVAKGMVESAQAQAVAK